METSMNAQVTPDTDEAARSKYRALRDAWQNATAHFSVAGRTARHPTYRQIVAMGVPAVPFLLADLERFPGLIWALEEIMSETMACLDALTAGHDAAAAGPRLGSNLDVLSLTGVAPGGLRTYGPGLRNTGA